MSFLKDMAAFMLARKKFWLLPVMVLMTMFGGLIVLTKGSVVAPFIYTLVLMTIVARVSRRSITTAPPRSCATARSSRPRRKSASPARSTTRAFRRMRCAIASQEAGIAWSRYRFRHLLRKAVPEIRAAARDLSGLRAEGLRLVPHGDPALAEGEAVSEIAADRAACAPRRPMSTGRRSCASPSTTRAMRRARSIPRRSVTPRSSPWTASANGRRPAWASAAGNQLSLERGDPFSPFARAALFGVHLLHRLQGQFRRVQGDGACALRRAEIRASHHGQSDRHAGGRLVPHEHGLFRLLHRPDA